MTEMEALSLKFDALQAIMKHEIDRALDEMSIGGSEFHTKIL